MSKKRNYHIKYSIQDNGEEFPRQITVTAVKNEVEAAAKLHKLCTVKITITHIEEVL